MLGMLAITVDDMCKTGESQSGKDSSNKTAGREGYSIARSCSGDGGMVPDTSCGIERKECVCSYHIYAICLCSFFNQAMIL